MYRTMLAMRNIIVLITLLSQSIVIGFNWTITHSDRQFLNIHLDPDHVQKQCSQDNELCVPITFSFLFCNLLNSADIDVEVRNTLISKTCGFVFGEPMVCCPLGELSQNPICDLNGDRTKPGCGKRAFDDDDVRIAQGKDATPGDWPWMVLLGYSQEGTQEPFYECGGTLITQRHILTSAHCLDKRKVTEVRLGDTDLSSTLDCRDQGRKQCAKDSVLRGVAGKTIHPLYNPQTLEFDVGILTLDRAVDLSDYIIPVCLPLVPREPDQSSLWFVTGWGAKTNRRILSDTLQQVQVDITSRSDCGSQWSVKVGKSQVCAAGAENGASVCEGDSGGPLITHRPGEPWEQGGVVSSGSSICGDSKPTFFTLINQEILKWIEAEVEGQMPKRV